MASVGWEDAAIALMREGFGFEDIAVKLRASGLSISTENVRDLAGRLEKIGALSNVYRGTK